MTIHAKRTLISAEQIAVFYKSASIDPFHILLAIILEKGSLGSNILETMGIDEMAVDDEIIKFKEAGEHSQTPKVKPQLSEVSKNVILKAANMASKNNFPYLGTEHILQSLMELEDRSIMDFMQEKKTDNNPKKTTLRAETPENFFAGLSKLFEIPEITLSAKKDGKGSQTPYLDQFSVNINREAKNKNEIVIGRKNEIDRITTILGRKTKNNPVLIGDPGVGKTAIVYGLANLINESKISPHFANKKILYLDLALLVAGTSFRGEFEARLKEIIEEASADPNIILFIDEIHTIVGTGNTSGSLDAANILKPALARGDLQCIGATTFEEYKKYIEKDPALERRFQPVVIKEPSMQQTKEILRGLKTNYEQFHNVKISNEIIEQVVDLCAYYVQDRFFPDKAIDVIDEAASRTRGRQKVKDFSKKMREVEQKLEEIIKKKGTLVAQEKYDEAIAFRAQEKRLANQLKTLQDKQTKTEKSTPIAIAPQEITETIASISNVPTEKIAAKQLQKMTDIETKMKRKVVGQDAILQQIAGSIYRSQSGISSQEKPIGSFLFLGPTGVGKTLTAKVLAEEIFGSKDALIRIDMSEFMERHNVSQLIGAPAGYVGYGEGGKLTEQVRRRPYSVVLFDEIEKAHPDIFNILLQILEEGFLTDAEGRRVSFRNAIVILTSNIGTSEFTASAKLGFASKSENELKRDFSQIKQRVVDQLKKELKPELLNRLDQVVVFNPIGTPELEKIFCLEIKQLSERLKKKGYAMKIAKEAEKHIVQKSVNISEGARLVRKNIQEMIEDLIARKITSGKMKKQFCVTLKNGRMEIV